MSSLVSQAVILLIDKGDRLRLLDNYIVVNTTLIVLLFGTVYLLLRTFKNTSVNTKVAITLISMAVMVLLLQPISTFIIEHESVAFFLIGSPISYIALLNLGIVSMNRIVLR